MLILRNILLAARGIRAQFGGRMLRTLSRRIWSRRLERVARDLRDPALQGRTISCIAFHHGFNDLTHFSKAFRQKFGLAPRDFRQAEVTAKAGPEVSLHA